MGFMRRITRGTTVRTLVAACAVLVATNGTQAGATAEAVVTVNPPGGSIDASTFGNGSFAIMNTSTGGERITSVKFDLTTSLLPDLVFDPAGTAGDIVAKPFTLNSAGGTGSIAHSFIGSFHNGVDADDGYDELEITYTDFDPGETMTFSIDNDPTTIKGTTAPGPNEAGSVSGVELIGSQVTVMFDDDTTRVAWLFRTGATLDASEAVATSSPLPAPAISVLRIGTGNAVVTSASQIVRVTGPVGADVEVLVVEGGLFINGTPNAMSGPFPNGYDVDPWEANSALTVTTYPATIGAMGFVEVPVTLTRFTGDGGYTLGSLDVTGRSTIVAALRDGAGRTGRTSNTIVLELSPNTQMCDEDLNGNAQVGFADLTQLLAAWGPCGACPEDLDASGIVGFADLTQLLAAWGPC